MAKARTRRPAANDGPARVRAYIAAAPPEARRKLRELRRIIRAAAPDAIEVISYGIPSFKLDGKGLAWYASWTQHCSVYPIGKTAQRTLASALVKYETSKGTIRFPLDTPLPAPLITRWVNARVADLRTDRRR